MRSALDTAPVLFNDTGATYFNLCYGVYTY